MTTVVFRDGFLYADRRVVLNNGVITDGCKITVSSKGDFAWAGSMSGDIASTSVIERVIRKELLDIRTKDEYMGHVVENILRKTRYAQLIVAFKKGAVHFKRDGFSVVTKDLPFLVISNESYYSKGALLAEPSMEHFYKITSEYSTCTSRNFDSFDTRTLKKLMRPAKENK